MATAETRTRTPWLALVDLPRPEHIERQMGHLARWLEENPGAHPERRAVVQTLHTECDRIRRELATARWILDQAINFKPLEDPDVDR